MLSWNSPSPDKRDHNWKIPASNGPIWRGHVNEMGDVLVTLDLLADELGIDLSSAVADKFNKTSIKNGLQTRL